ncbi:MAG: DEAD/DEAH box helicase [Nitrososphaerales archaeon]|nr:DEAD/DEAH box helicase [Nitrososphaerales archaeon]
MPEIYQLEKRVEDRIHEMGWAELTPIQRKAFPVILRERSALVIAPTGSGKTEAVVMPILSLLSYKEPKTRGIRMLYVTPLRALNRDIFRRIINYAEMDGLKAEIRHGDTPIAIRRKMVEEPPDILITTPETLGILLVGKRLRLHLKSVEWIVIDELHELIGNERGAHLTISLEKIEALSNEQVKRVGLSATLGDPNMAARFLSGVNRKCAILVDNSIRKYEIKCNYIDGSLLDIANFVLNHFKEMNEEKRTILLFTNTRDEAEFIGAILKAKSPEIPIEVHHGSLSKEIRESAELKLRSGEASIVVCTSSLELGLDIGAVSLVVQLGSPRQAVKLMQRVGRSRHKLDTTALGMIVTNRLDDELEGTALIERVQKRWLENNQIHEKALDVLTHHLVGLSLNGSFSLKDALHIFKRAYPFRDVEAEDLDSCLQVLKSQGIINYDGEIVRRRQRTYDYYYENISTIPDVQQFEVIDLSSKKTIGRLDHFFVGEYGEPGKTFVLKGSSWRIISIDDEKMELHVEPISKDLTTIPYWTGELIPVDLSTAKEVGRLRRQIISNKSEFSEEQRKRLLKSRECLGVIPDENTIVIEKKKASNVIVIHACFGSKVNQTLATLLSTLISSMIGYPVEAKSDPYRILLSYVARLEAKDIIEALYDEFDIEEILSASVVGTHPLNWKTWHVAKKFGVISKDAQYDRRASSLIQKVYEKTALCKEVMRELFLEKYNILTTREILLAIREGRMKVIQSQVDDFSPLAKPILEYSSSFTTLPAIAEKAILDLVKERLDKKRHRIMCLSCSWESVVRTKDAGESLICPICRSRLITSTYLSDDELSRIIKQKIKGKKLKSDEETKFRKAWKVSSLIQNFGNRTLLVLSGFGVGPDTAARILRKVADFDQLVREIYTAEKTFVRTRGFWGD